MPAFSLPYGQASLTCHLPDGLAVEVVEPPRVAAAADPLAVVEAALDAPLGGVRLADLGSAAGRRGVRSAAIAINDKTRPVPHDHLLPPLLRRLEALGLPPVAITLLIAAGAHPPMPPAEFTRVIPAEVLVRHPILCHNADDAANLAHLGTTSRGTPVWVNRRFLDADLRLVVGNVEPHQFQGFSGGVKSAAIGLAGRETINHNHAHMIDPRARLGSYAGNPARQDVEEIGALIGVHFALNAVLDGQKRIVHAVAGEPRAVMEAAIPLSRRVSQAPVAAPFDLVIASAGGHPKDLNLYQAQKALAHAALVSRDGGTVIVVAACPEGAGSRSYEAWMEGMGSYQEVFARFEQEGFRVGPHKAVQIARDAARLRTILVSSMTPALVRRLLLTPAASVDEALELALPDLPDGARVAIMPRASSTIPHIGQSGQNGTAHHAQRTP
ncbi:MAG: nickel-dependent lactate racemase [Anaerolineae bacterium]|nr:nickel-dependent lactate racemase [Anaerolineae bacterium]